MAFRRTKDKMCNQNNFRSSKSHCGGCYVPPMKCECSWGGSCGGGSHGLGCGSSCGNWGSCGSSCGNWGSCGSSCGNCSSGCSCHKHSCCRPSCCVKKPSCNPVFWVGLGMVCHSKKSC